MSHRLDIAGRKDQDIYKGSDQTLSLRGDMSCQTLSEEKTIEAAQKFAQQLIPGDIVCLHGDLGAGKTVFAKGLIEALTKTVTRNEVTSPTFVTLNLYENVAHFDLYRLESIYAFKACGFEEYLEEPYIAIIEWPEIVTSLLPENAYHLTIEKLGETQRSIV